MSETAAEATSPPWVNHYYLLLSNATGAAILMLPSSEGWRLPYVRVENIWLSETGRTIPLLREALGSNTLQISDLQHKIDFDFTLLRYAAYLENEKERWSRLFFILEPAQPLAQPPLGGQWVDRLALYHTQLALPEQTAFLMQYVEENEPGKASPPIDRRRSPWARPGWFADASAWIEEAMAELGYTPTGPIEQRRSWSLSCLLTAPSSAGNLYFKAAAPLPLFVNEPALTQTLSELYPGQVPTPLKIDRAKRWMLMAEFGPEIRSEKEFDPAPILAAYGALQRESAGHLDQLAAAGCIDRTIPVMMSQIDPLITDPITQEALTPQEYEALTALAPQLKERCERVAAYNLPATLLHGDLHFGNITRHNSSYLFFDWTDAAIGFPFVDHFQLYFYDQEKPEATHGRDSYLQLWQEYESPARLLEVWELAKPLCALHHSISYLSIINNIEPLVRAELFHGLPDHLRFLLRSF